ncbi:glycosyltransferase [Prescottella sp. D32]|uniref:glycosyltransferase n=1 Tax=Prescottella sp. D32 TaxID=3029740 RepID=UPI00307A2C81
MAPNVTILSTADFHSAVWTNKQYMAVGLAGHTDVQYIESMGLRTPTLSRSDLARMANRVNPFRAKAGGVTPAAPSIPESLTIISPPVVPVHGSSAVRGFNRRLVERILVPKLRADEGDVLWTFSPITYGLEDRFSKVVYHSVDLLHTLPGVPARALLDAERRLVRAADAVIASSKGVHDHLCRLGAKVHLWENVADVELFGKAPISERLPRVLFAGNITPTKVNFELLHEVARRGIRLDLAGPVSIDGVESRRELEELLDNPNVKYLGNLPLEDLARNCAESTVGVIPYHVNDYTRGVFPLKVYEYMSAGMDVVSTPIPSLEQSLPEGVKLAPPESFVDAVEQAVNEWTVEAASLRRRLAEGHSWSHRIDQAWNLIGGGS